MRAAKCRQRKKRGKSQEEGRRSTWVVMLFEQSGEGERGGGKGDVKEKREGKKERSVWSYFLKSFLRRFSPNSASCGTDREKRFCLCLFRSLLQFAKRRTWREVCGWTMHGLFFAESERCLAFFGHFAVWGKVWRETVGGSRAGEGGGGRVRWSGEKCVWGVCGKKREWNGTTK